MSRRLLLLLLLLGCSSRSSDKGLVIIAIDGMDPGLLSQYMAEGRMPALSAMAERGGYTKLGTSIPPQSPVAWSNFLTGHGSEHHGIYDFVHRDPHEMAPYLSTSKAEGPAYVMEVSDLLLPIGGGVSLLRRGVPFWSEIADDGVDTTIVKIPANYPPVEPSPAEVLSGMGTPDLLGTPGLFQVFTTDARLLTKDSVGGGRINRLRVVTPLEALGELEGPPDPVSKEQKPMTIPLSVYFGEDGKSAVVRMGDAEVLLIEREWSDWVEVSFETEVGISVSGIVRVYASSLGEIPTVYVSPVNLDPMAPAQPISAPDAYAAELANVAGRFYTQGMPEDTKALLADVLSDAEFLAQEELIFEERVAMLDRELNRYDDGLLFFYFSSVDLVSHMFYRTIKPGASKEDLKFKHVIPDLYAKMDGVVKDVVERVDERATVVVMSDHGFAPYDRKVHLNTWLVEKGYLALAKEKDRKATVFGHVDWARTRAYALGLNQLFLNLKGREPDGIVEPADADALTEEIGRALEAFVDPSTGRRVVSRVFRPDPGTFPDRVPELIVGYARGYRSSDESALGRVVPGVLEDNEDKWSGDHCMDPAHVPGVLLSTAPLAAGDWSLVDVGATVRAHFGLAEPEERTFFEER